MATSFDIPIAADGSIRLHLPDQCLSCASPATTESVLTVARLVMRKQRQIQLTIRQRVPHCQKCANASKSLFLIGLIPSLIGFLLVGGLVFVAVVYGAWAIGLDDYARPQDAPSLVLGAFVGLLAGLVGGLLAELITRLALLPFWGKSMLHAPLFVVQLLNDSDYVAGLTLKVASDGKQVRLTFENVAIAQTVAGLNGFKRTP